MPFRSRARRQAKPLPRRARRSSQRRTSPLARSIRAMRSLPRILAQRVPSITSSSLRRSTGLPPSVTARVRTGAKLPGSRKRRVALPSLNTRCSPSQARPQPSPPLRRPTGLPPSVTASVRTGAKLPGSRKRRVALPSLTTRCSPSPPRPQPSPPVGNGAEGFEVGEAIHQRPLLPPAELDQPVPDPGEPLAKQHFIEIPPGQHLPAVHRHPAKARPTVAAGALVQLAIRHQQALGEGAAVVGMARHHHKPRRLRREGQGENQGNQPG